MRPELIPWPEVLQIVAAILGVALNAWGLWCAVTDFLLIERARVNGGKRIVAIGNLRNVLFRFTVTLIVLVIGVVLLFMPPSPIEVRYLIAFGFTLIGIAMIASTLLDRLERVALFQELRRRRQGAVDPALDGVISMDREGRVRSWSPGAELLFGYSAREMIGEPLTCLMPERYRVAHERGVRRYLLTGESAILGRPIAVVGLTKAGAEIRLELTVTQLRTTDGAKFTGILRLRGEPVEDEVRAWATPGLAVRPVPDDSADQKGPEPRAEPDP